MYKMWHENEVIFPRKLLNYWKVVGVIMKYTKNLVRYLTFITHIQHITNGGFTIAIACMKFHYSKYMQNISQSFLHMYNLIAFNVIVIYIHSNNLGYVESLNNYCI